LGGSKTCAQVSLWYSGLWPGLFEGMEFDWWAILIQIGQDVLVTEKVLQVVVLDWAQQWCLGSVGSRSQWLSVLRRLSI
jgi:hypothetical protein